MRIKTLSWILVPALALGFSACTSPATEEPDNTPVEENPSDEKPKPSLPEDAEPKNQFTKLYWADEFEGDAIDESVWWIQNTDSHNNELQCYKCGKDHGNVVTAGKDPKSGKGCMIITAHRLSEACPHDRFITSGKVSTQVGDWRKDWVSTTYGRVEASIKLPKTYRGLWPAFWMMGNDVQIRGWAACGEIDIMEIGSGGGYTTVEKSERYLNGACHFGTGWENGKHYYRSQFKTYDYSLQDDEFHLYTLIWTDKSLRCYIDLDKYPDARPYFKVDISDKEAAATQPGSYFHKPFYLMLNLAVGGDYTNIKDPAKITALEDEVSMYVDYVRIYHCEDEAYHHPNDPVIE